MDTIHDSLTAVCIKLFSLQSVKNSFEVRESDQWFKSLLWKYDHQFIKYKSCKLLNLLYVNIMCLLLTDRYGFTASCLFWSEGKKCCLRLRLLKPWIASIPSIKAFKFVFPTFRKIAQGKPQKSLTHKDSLHNNKVWNVK